MTAQFRLDAAREQLFDGAGRRFEPMTRAWQAPEQPVALSPGDGVDALGAATWLQRESSHPLRIPIGVIGPREASGAQMLAALCVGELLAECGFVVVCGGRQGVMQAVCEGIARNGGTSIGLLPEADPSYANHYVSIALATGIGEARNALIARASLCLVAIGDSFGTLSEVALGRHFGKRVFGLEDAPKVDGVEHVGDPREAVTRVAETALAIAG
jgi:uncharacterized protein (TIGR00725 family)